MALNCRSITLRGACRQLARFARGNSSWTMDCNPSGDCASCPRDRNSTHRRVGPNSCCLSSDGTLAPRRTFPSEIQAAQCRAATPPDRNYHLPCQLQFLLLLPLRPPLRPPKSLSPKDQDRPVGRNPEPQAGITPMDRPPSPGHSRRTHKRSAR